MEIQNGPDEEVLREVSMEVSREIPHNTMTNVIDDRETRETASTTTTTILKTMYNLTSNQTIPVVEKNYMGCMDVGNFLDKLNLDLYTKYSILRNHWIPPLNYEYPWSEHIRAGIAKKRKPLKKHLDNYPWLVLSDLCKGLFYGYLEIHKRNKYHHDALQSNQQFLLAYENPNNSDINQINSFRFKQVTENRERLKPIIETLILCGNQNIPLRGYRDDGELLNSNSQLLKNDGNFRENSLSLKEVGVYAIIFDETTDMSHTEQLSLSLRYVYDEKIYERFIQFVDAYNSIQDSDIVSGESKLTGRAIGHIVLNILENFGLDSKLCVMTSNDIGAVTTILEACRMAVCCPCFSHALNISLSQSSKVISIRNTVSILKEVIAFFNSSAKRQIVLKNILIHNLKGLCQTRWIEMHDDVLQFKSSLSKIIESLVEIQSWTDKASSSKALSLVSTICTSEFLISLYSLIDILKHSLVVSPLLQSNSLDLQNATQATQTHRMATELEFEIKLPRLVKTMNHRSNYPTEGDGDKAIEKYYRCSIYIPLLDGIYTDLKTRLNPNTLKLFDLRLLIPKIFLNIIASDKNITRKILQERILKIVPMFNYSWQNDDYTKDVLAEEYDLWFNMWQNQSSNIEIKVPSTAISSLIVCSKDMFPIISSLLRILSTLPVSTATVERSFSTLKRVKTWLRATISQERNI
ncbi:uncharacterized protein LOC103307994 [Acyrthosiphon pisum]|uniref:HAT C-terminal dimerisation domain-containing protein n=1 Tax=Acyrthosiphon pisum TaxID=7029 RepID=A0A8R1X0L5_ACYPI|nr:uncharacterized protein LOC103307994 [Acyrthosiphon pisum]|eukprot:XP_008178788.1 PREDICTED: uncharacterized protein LOC103307994 [Acyrthosiphon pisum]